MPELDRFDAEANLRAALSSIQGRTMEQYVRQRDKAHRAFEIEQGFRERVINAETLPQDEPEAVPQPADAPQAAPEGGGTAQADPFVQRLREDAARVGAEQEAEAQAGAAPGSQIGTFTGYAPGVVPTSPPPDVEDAPAETPAAPVEDPGRLPGERPSSLPAPEALPIFQQAPDVEDAVVEVATGVEGESPRFNPFEDYQQWRDRVGEAASDRAMNARIGSALAGDQVEKPFFYAGESGKAVPAGTASALDEISQFGIEIWDGVGAMFGAETPAKREEFRVIRDLVGIEPTSDYGKAAASVVQFIAGMAVVAPLTGGAGAVAMGTMRGVGLARAGAKLSPRAARYLKGMVDGAVADAVAFDPNDERLAGMLNQIPELEGIVPDYLAVDDAETSVYEQRMKRAVEGAGLGVLFDTALLPALRAYRSAKKVSGERDALPPSERQAVDEGNAKQAEVEKGAVVAGAKKKKTDAEMDVLASDLASLGLEEREIEKIGAAAGRRAVRAQRKREKAAAKEQRQFERGQARAGKPVAKGERQEAREAPVAEDEGGMSGFDDPDAEEAVIEGAGDTLRRAVDEETPEARPMEGAEGEGAADEAGDFEGFDDPDEAVVVTKTPEEVAEENRRLSDLARQDREERLKLSEEQRRVKELEEARVEAIRSRPIDELTTEQIVNAEPGGLVREPAIALGWLEKNAPGAIHGSANRQAFDRVLVENGDALAALPVEKKRQLYLLLSRVSRNVAAPTDEDAVDRAARLYEEAMKRPDLPGTSGVAPEELPPSLSEQFQSYEEEWSRRVDPMLRRMLRDGVGPPPAREMTPASYVYGTDAIKYRQDGEILPVGHVDPFPLRARQEAAMAGDSSGDLYSGKAGRFGEDFSSPDVDMGPMLERQILFRVDKDAPLDASQYRNPAAAMLDAERVTTKLSTEVRKGLSTAQIVHRETIRGQTRHALDELYWQRMVDSTLGLSQARGFEWEELAKRPRWQAVSDRLQQTGRQVDNEAAANTLTLMNLGRQTHLLAQAASSSPDALEGFVRSALRYQHVGKQLVGEEMGQDLLAASLRLDGKSLLRKMGGATDGSEQATAAARERVQAMAAAVARAADPDAGGGLEDAMRLTRDWVLETANKAEGMDWKRGLFTLRASSMLSAPSTHGNNFIGNSVPLLLGIPERLIGNTVMRAAFQGLRGELSPAEMKNAWADTVATFSGMGQGFWLGARMATLDFAMHNRFLTSGVRQRAYNRAAEKGYGFLLREFRQNVKGDPMNPELGPEYLNAVQRKDGSAMSAQGWVSVEGMQRNKWIQTPFDFLQSADMLFKAIHYGADRRIAALQIGRERGLAGDALRDYARDWQKRKSRYAEDHVSSLRTAEKDTYTKRTKVTTAVSQATSAGPWMMVRLAAPFIRTPWNLTTWAAERTPGLNFFFKESRDKLLRGSPNEQAMEATRLAMGGGVFAGAAALVESGQMTGCSPGTRWARTGVPQCSIKVGDDWVDYRKLPFLGAVFTATSSAMELWHSAETEGEFEMAGAAMHGMASLVGGLLEQNPLLGADTIGKVMDWIANPTMESGKRFIENEIGSQLDALVPGSGFREAVVRMSQGGAMPEGFRGGGMMGDDETLAEQAQELVENAFRQAFPEARWFREDYPRRNLYGEPISANGPGDMMVDGMKVSWPKHLPSAMLGPMAWLEGRDDELSMEIRRLGGLGQMGWIQNVPRTKEWPSADGVVKIEYSQEEYDYISRIAGQQFKQRAEAAIQSPGWRLTLGDPEHQSNWLRSIRSTAVRNAETLARARFPDLNPKYDRAGRAVFARAE